MIIQILVRALSVNVSINIVYNRDQNKTKKQFLKLTFFKFSDKADKPKTLSIHVGLVHNKLDFLLQDKNLVYQKRTSYFAKPKKLSIGPTCPVCDQRFTKAQNRDHVSWHFIEELRAIVQEFDDPNQCPQCPYSADTNEKMVKHVALGKKEKP